MVELIWDQDKDGLPLFTVVEIATVIGRGGAPTKKSAERHIAIRPTDAAFLQENNVKVSFERISHNNTGHVVMYFDHGAVDDCNLPQEILVAWPTAKMGREDSMQLSYAGIVAEGVQRIKDYKPNPNLFLK